MHVKEPVSLLTSRCWVRPVQLGDHQPLFDATRYDGFTRWLSWEQPADEQAVALMVQRQVQRWNAGEAHALIVVERATNLVLGGAELKPTEPVIVAGGTGTSALELGYWTHPARQGQGFASEFVPAVVRWAFEGLGADELIAAVGVDNAASQRLVARLGFVEVDRQSTCGAVKRFENVRYRLPHEVWKGTAAG